VSYFVRLLERFAALILILGVLFYVNLTRMPHSVGEFLFERMTVINILVAVGFLAVWSACFPAGNLQGEQTGFLASVGKTLKGTLCVTGMLGLLLTAAHSVTPLTLILPVFFLASFSLVCARTFLVVLVGLTPSNHRTDVLILGTGPLARRAWKEVRTRYFRSVNLVGFVDNECVENGSPEISTMYLGKINDLESILLRTPVDLMVIALPVKSCYEDVQRAIHAAEEVGVEFMQFDSTFQLKRLSKNTMAPNVSMYPYHSSSSLAEQTFKRFFDIVISATALALLAPVLAAIAIAVRFSDPGPAIFTQERYGFCRRKFALLKFRTMVIDAEKLMEKLESQNEADGPIFKMRNDPRITKMGRFLRKTSLDELPQLWNVLTGDMSLVGPRPMSLRDVKLFSSAHLMRRFRVKPGITGLWQVSGRSSTTFDHWMSMDFRYIDDWSIWLDFKILFQTIPAVLKGTGAM
jgi:exopolysaccharide biosynthesis polyprenyl glycosylphosphotransferase